MFSNRVGNRERFEHSSVGSSSIPLETNSTPSFHGSTPHLRELQARMVPAKDTLTLKCEFSVRHLVLLVSDDDITHFWNLCLFI